MLPRFFLMMDFLEFKEKCKEKEDLEGGGRGERRCRTGRREQEEEDESHR